MKATTNKYLQFKLNMQYYSFSKEPMVVTLNIKDDQHWSSPALLQAGAWEAPNPTSMASLGCTHAYTRVDIQTHMQSEHYRMVDDNELRQ